MSALTQPIETISSEIFYPESDGLPMADNTEQFKWIVTIKENLDALLPDAFVAGDLFWYPVEKKPNLKQAPDVLVAFGRPKGKRGSYKQWEEKGIAPQVVFEILSPGNRAIEMIKKDHFYQRYGAEEYYLYDPETNDITGWIYQDGKFEDIEDMQGWVSPRLGIRFEQTAETLVIFRPDGKRFLTFQELEARAVAAEARAEEAEAKLQTKNSEIERLKQRLKELGVEP
ncbi:MAG TPA: Uma2 family endonuclease [Acidobacteriota bacterium]|nr:Uma2 family endonuclease [Acidobacteriota bacterium]